MDTKRDPAAARTAVTRLLKQYFETLRTRLAAGTSEVWSRIEQRLAQTPPTSDSDLPPERPQRTAASQD